MTRDELLYTRFGIFFKQEGINADGTLAENIYRKYLEEGHETVAGARELLEDLGKRYEIYVVTNGLAQTQVRRMRESGLDRLVRNTFISEQLGANKPEKAFFDACRAFLPDVAADECVMIGDSLTADITGGKNAGMKTIWYNHTHRPVPERCEADQIVESLSELKNLL